MKDVMVSAYYAEKIPSYWKEIQSGERKLATFKTIWNIFLKDVKEFNVKNVFAHNASFDLNALNNTIRYITKSEYRYFFPRKIEIYLCGCRAASVDSSPDQVYRSPTERRWPAVQRAWGQVRARRGCRRP